MDTDDKSIEQEERGIYLVMLLVGLPIIGALLIEKRSVDGGNTVMLLTVALAVIGLTAGLKAVLARRIPHARALRSSDRATGNRRPLR
jgi:hypothetical protein